MLLTSMDNRKMAPGGSFLLEAFAKLIYNVLKPGTPPELNAFFLWPLGRQCSSQLGLRQTDPVNMH